MMLFYFLALTATLVFAEDLILTPSSNTKPVVMFFAPGFGIGPEAYEPLGSVLQSSFKSDLDLDLTFAVPQMTGNITTVGLEKAIKNLAKKIDVPSTDYATLYSGHSVGGALLPYIVRNKDNMPDNFNTPQGMILLASFLVREFKSDAVPEVGPGQYQFDTCPVMTIGGELDGLCRITRIAESYHTQISLNTDPVAAKHKFPVTAIEGISHMQFASGPIPSNVLKNDLKPEVSAEEAHSLIANDVVAFASGILQDKWDTLDSRMEESNKLFSPIVLALELEGYHQFKPPCYCEAIDEYGGLEYGTCPSQPGCTPNSPWTQTFAQQILVQNNDVNEGKGIIIEAMDSQHIVTEEDPSCHLPHIHKGIDRDSNHETANSVPANNPGNGKEGPPLCDSDTDCTLTVNTITQLMYQTGSEYDIWRIDVGNDNIDTGSSAISASEMKAKMKSRQSLLQAANNTDATSGKVTFEEYDNPEVGLCAQVNLAALTWAEQVVPAKTLQRYKELGQKYVVNPNHGDEKVCIAGPCWIWANLQYKGLKEGEEEVEIIAPSFAFKNENPYPCNEKMADGSSHVGTLPCTAGMHYCKLLSPARVVEWMYVDSLRLHDGIDDKKNMKTSTTSSYTANDDAKCCASCPTGTDKYYSIVKNLFVNNCGESCIAPADYDLYKKLEPGLKLAETNTPCNDNGYTKYKETETHGKGTKVAIELDMYTQP